MTWERTADVVIVGSGAAGISAALTAAASGASVLVTTKDLTGGASPLAQGGLAAAIGPGDTAGAHAADTIAAGAGLCDADTVGALAAGAPGAIDWLVRQGTRLERERLRLEGGHSRNRITHSGDDATGAEVHRALLRALLASRVEILDRAIAIDVSPGELLAAIIRPGGGLDPGLVRARAVILAAGGLGQAYATTSNPPGATGDALAMAARAGAVLRDPEFVQFHPTVLWRDGATGQCPLITEALRGAGAVLRDLDGRPLMAGRHPRGDLAPRDVVAARVHEVMTGAGSRHVWLDATALGRDVLEDGFPTVTAACRKQGVDPVTGLIPVAPGAHYACGGIRADLDGRTSVPGLYAIGEAASTGVHGANRLASNSLVEAVITGRRAGALAGALAREPKRRAGDRTAEHGGAGRAAREGAGLGAAAASAGAEPAGAAAGGEGAPLSRPVLAAHMSRYAGVLRDAEGLRTLARILRGAGGAGGEPAWRVRATEFDLASLEAGNLRVVSALIAAAALRRAESRGAHRRGDAPGTAPGARHSLARWNGGDIDITWEDA